MKRATRMPLVIASGGLLALALILEATMANMHFVSLGELHEHTAVPVTVHLIAYSGALLALSPALTDIFQAMKRREPPWKIVVVLAVGMLIAFGRVIAGAAVALLFLAGSVVWDASRGKA